MPRGDGKPATGVGPPIFFYGLFMDRARLERQGLEPEVLGRARLPDYELRLGERASLVRSAGEVAYGVVMRLREAELRRLYAPPSVADYRPEPVRVRLLDLGDSSSPLAALCYNLPPAAIGAVSDRAYARELGRLAAALDLPDGYVRRIAALAGAG